MVLPAPLAPRSPTTSPPPILRFTASTAVKEPKRMVTLRVSASATIDLNLLLVR